MKTDQFPYQEYTETPAWIVVAQAIEDLVQNRDLIEQTDRRYTVGLLIKRLNENGMLTTKAVAKKIKDRY